MRANRELVLLRNSNSLSWRDEQASNSRSSMTKSEGKPTPPTQQDARQARLAAELRANLKKRKALAREKSTLSDDAPET
jgi:hypothetical protein